MSVCLTFPGFCVCVFVCFVQCSGLWGIFAKRGLQIVLRVKVGVLKRVLNVYLIDIHRVIYVKKTLKKVKLWFVNLRNSRFLCNFASDN